MWHRIWENEQIDVLQYKNIKTEKLLTCNLSTMRSGRKYDLTFYLFGQTKALTGPWIISIKLSQRFIAWIFMNRWKYVTMYHHRTLADSKRLFGISHSYIPARIRKQSWLRLDNGRGTDEMKRCCGLRFWIRYSHEYAKVNWRPLRFQQIVSGTILDKNSYPMSWLYTLVISNTNKSDNISKVLLVIMIIDLTVIWSYSVM